METDVTQADAAPGEALGDGDQVLEPYEDLVCAGTQAHEGEQGEDSCDTDTVVWHTGLGALQEELGGLAVLSDTEEITRAGVQECVSGGCCGGENDSVDDMRQNRDTSVLAGNDPRRLLGT